MCDVFAAIGVTKGVELRKFMKEAVPKIAGYRNKQGLGYTAIKKNKEIFGERWLDPEDGFKGNPLSLSDRDIIDELSDLMEEAPDLNCYNTFGTQNWKDVTAAIYHARFATCEKSIANVHPFLSEDGKTSLIHNGVIKNHEEFDKRYSTCDSEGILTQYLKHKVPNKKKNIQKVFDDLDGAFTVMATSVDANGNRYVDIFKDGGRTLYVTRIDQLGGVVFSSDKAIIEETCKKLNWKHTNKISKVKNNTFCRFDAVTGKLVGKVISCQPRRTLHQSSNSNSNQTGTWPYQNKDYDKYTNFSSTNDSSKENGSRQNRSNMETRKNNGSSLGTVDRNGVCTVAQFFINEYDLDDSVPNSDDNKDAGGKEVIINAASGEEVSNKPLLDRLASNHTSQKLVDNLHASDSKYHKELDEIINTTEASDSKYGIVHNEMSGADIDTLEEYSIKLTLDELDVLDELPDDMRFSYLKSHYEENIGSL